MKTQATIELSEARSSGLHEISQAAKLSGVTAKMIRYYESINLIPEAKRTLSNYRVYSDHDIKMLSFIKRSRTLGFSLEQIQLLLSLWNDKHRTSAEVRKLTLTHVEELDQKIAEMQEMRSVLWNLAMSCCGNNDPDCPILEDLSQSISSEQL